LFHLQKSFNLPSDATVSFSLICPGCGGQTILFDHKFTSEKRTMLKWKVVEYLSDHGFRYQHIYTDSQLENYAGYPSAMEEIKAFVLKYKSQALALG
jgi:hypothetical protein